MEEALIRVKDLCKIYNPGENEVRALDHINLEIDKGEFVADTVTAIVKRYYDQDTWKEQIEFIQEWKKKHCRQP